MVNFFKETLNFVLIKYSYNNCFLSMDFFIAFIFLKNDLERVLNFWFYLTNILTFDDNKTVKKKNMC